MTKLHRYTMSKKSLIQFEKFRSREAGLCKIPGCETPRFQIGVLFAYVVFNQNWSIGLPVTSNLI